MPKVLFVNACVRDDSRTISLAREVLTFLGGEMEEVALYGAGLAPLDADGIRMRDAALLRKDFSDGSFDLARQFSCADTVVIAAPYWDLMFPAVLKLYFEAVTVNGLTFAYSEQGIPTGLCRARRMIYVTTAGGPIVENFGFDYACALARGFYGIDDVACIRAEGLDVYGADVDAILLAAKASVASILADYKTSQ